MARVSNVVTLALPLLVIFLNAPLLAEAAAEYDIVALGGNGDGKTDSTKALMSAWSSACDASEPVTINIPKGSFLIKTAKLDGPCKNDAITFQIDGTLTAPSDYNDIGNSHNWIIFEHVNGVSILGGALDGQGCGLWDCKNSGKSCPTGATNLEFSNSKNILISGLSSVNSQMFHIVINGCQNVKLQGVRVSASGDSPNTDGIHIGASTAVTILNSKIGTGDDCVSIGPGTTSLWIENVVCGPGHGISIGSLGKDAEEDGVQNVTVKTVTFSGSENGVRIKSWARPSSGFARNILFQHAIMNNVQNPIIIDQHYCPDEKGCPNEASGVRISDVTYDDIHGTSATEVAVKFNCSSANPCSGIQMQDVKLTYRNRAAQSSCDHADGTTSGVVQPNSCFS